MKPSDFFTRTQSNAGAKLVLEDPLTGQPSNESLLVRGLESDRFREALAAKHRRNLEILTLPEAEQEAASMDAEYDLYVSLVAGWSFEEECSPEAVKQLFIEAPQIKLAVDRFAGNRANFLQERSPS